MRGRAEKLRWMSLGGALLLAAVLAAFFGLANYRAGKVWQRILARNGVNLQRETNGFTYSQSQKGRTIFTLHAAKAVPQGENRWTLHDAVLILYGKDNRADRIYGSQFEYDQTEGTARAVGEVHMDLQAPRAANEHGAAAAAGAPAPGLGFTPEDESHADPTVIHVRTSGLVYVRKLGVAATQEPAEFRYKGMTCTSRGAEFDSGQSTLRLLADVHLSGTLREAAFNLVAAKADLDRTLDTVDLQRPEVTSAGRRARADHARLHLKQDGSLETGEANGGVLLTAKTQTVSAPRLQASFGPDNRPQRTVFSGGVQLLDRAPGRTIQGQAVTVDLRMDSTGRLQTAMADGGATMRIEEPGPAGAAVRTLRAQHVQAAFVPAPGGTQQVSLQSVHMTGAAELSAQTPGQAGSTQAITRVDGDELTTTFGSGRARQVLPQRLTGSGHTRLERTAEAGSRQVSTGDALEVNFAERAGAPGAAGQSLEVQTAVQTGHVELAGWSPAKAGAAEPATGVADRAVYEGSAGTLTLTAMNGGRAEVDDTGTQLRAPEIVLHQGTGDGEARGGVIATTGGQAGQPATHVIADHAALLHAAQLSEFFGTDAQPAQMWQAGSQVQAARLVLDGAHHTMSARPEAADGVVHAVFASARGEGPGKERSPERSPERIPERIPERGTEPKEGRVGQRAGFGTAPGVPAAGGEAVRVTAAAMDYNDGQREATFRGGVRLQDANGTVAAQRGVAFLSALPADGGAAGRAGAGTASLGGQLERMVMLGAVRLEQPGRSGTGEELTYTAATDRFALTGTPGELPRIRDAQQGVVTGVTLLFGAADSSIVVAGTPATGKQASPVRVHTETDLKH